MEFDINQLVTPVVLEYLEKGWHDQTIQCLLDAGFDDTAILQVSREGVGSMSKAFNSIFLGIDGFDIIETPFVWFVTNIQFDKHVPAFLASCLEDNPNVAAVHPKFTSDHPHIRNAKGRDIVPFVEWTAPMVRMSAMWEVGLLDEQLPYVGQDIDWSYRAKQKGFELMVDGHATVQHTYLYMNQPEPISRIRAALRGLYMDSTYAHLAAKYGQDWKQIICPTQTC